MAKKPSDDQLSDDEAEERAKAAMRRALTTPYKPQSEMKIGGKKSKTPKTKAKNISR